MSRTKGSKNKAPKRAARAKAGTAPENPRAVAGHNGAAEEQAKIDCFNAHRDKLRPLEARMEAVKKQVAEAYADAKKDKLPKKMFAYAKKLLGTKKQEDGVIGDIRMVRFVARAVGHSMADQLDLFVEGDKPSSISPESEGEQAFRAGAPAKPHYAPGTENYDAWMKGFYAEQDKKMQDFKPLKRKTKPVDEELMATGSPGEDWGDEDADPARPLN